MNVTLNGQQIAIDDACTVQQLLERQKLAAGPCAVEVNRKLVPKRNHDQHTLAGGDQIEIVTLVGGG
jgi:sulfur carrier protein